MSRLSICLMALVIGLPCAHLRAEHYKLFVLTGQSNSLGTTNGGETDVSPASDPADPRIRFYWHNVADATQSIGSSGGSFTTLQAQQGGYYPGSATHWGPEIGFARTLVRAGAGNIAIVKASRGGGGNTNWSKSAGGHMYAHVVNTVTAAATALTSAGDTCEIAGLLYLQGESDTEAEADLAGTRLQQLVDNLRADLPNAAGMKAVAGGIAAAGATRDVVRARQQAAADASDYIDFFPNLDLQAQVTDGLHFNKAAKLRIGERFAQAFFANGSVARHYGRLAFIGDSITQGGNGDRPSYRYQVFKRLAEAGVPSNPAAGYQFVGSVTGPYQNSVLTTPEVNGQAFSNVHDGHWGWRSFWINARVPLPASRRDANRGEGTLLNWTGQANPQQYAISSPDANVPYPDPAATGTGNTGATYVPDTVSIMIGINDLGDNNNSANQVVADIGTLVDQLRAANPTVRVFVNRLLYTNQTPAMRNAVDAVNNQLPVMAAAKYAASSTSPVWIIDANTGFNPATMTYDNVHPNAAGEQYIGDRVAAALGVIETPVATAAAPPPHEDKDSSDFTTRYEGNEIWNGSALTNNWSQTGTLTRSLPEPTDLRMVHPSTDGRWIEGTNAGWSGVAAGAWTFEVRLKCNANANGFVLWCGAGPRRILVEIHGNRTQDHADGGQAFNTPHDNLDGNFHVFRIVHDQANSAYHVFRDGMRLSPLAGVAYDQASADNRLILGDYTSGAFGNQYDITIDHVRFTAGAFLPPGVDSDGDGMTDAWEYLNFGGLTAGDPAGDPDEDGFTNLQEFGNGTNPLVADGGASIRPFPVFLFSGGGNAAGTPGSGATDQPPPGSHPADAAAGVRYHNGSSWTHLGAITRTGPETAFARLLWDAGYRAFGIVKATRDDGGNSLWEKGSADDSAYRELLAAGRAAAAHVPPGYDAVSFAALVHIQGEANDSTEAGLADTRFSTLLDNLRADLPGAASMQAILGEIGGSGANRDTTRARLSILASARADIGLARSTGISTHNDDGLAVHYTADGLALLGARIAAEVFAMNSLGTRPLPAWANLHAWYVGGHAAGLDGTGAVSRWASLLDGSAVRDLSRRVSGRVLRATVTANGGARRVMRFDGTSDLWANNSTEFGTLSGPRTVAVLCRLTGGGDGFLFDGSTNTGRTRAQVRGGSWQAGVTPAGASVAWNLADPATAAAAMAWQRHVFVFTPNAGNTATTVEHWVDGILAATVSENEATTLGGLILGSNGGSPFSRLPVDVAELAVFNKALDPSEITALDAAWDITWGTPSGPPFAVRVNQSARDIPRFGSHAVLEIEIDAGESGIVTLQGLDLALRHSSPAQGGTWRIHQGSTFNPSSTPLAETSAASGIWNASFSLPLAEGTNRLYLAHVPARRAALGSTIDASVESLGFAGLPEATVIPSSGDPVGALTLALVPLFTDVRSSGEGGVNTYRIPGIVCDSDGILHAVYDHRYSGGGDLPGNIDVGYSRSADGGATWSPSSVILDFDASVANSSGNGVGDPCILFDPVTDTLWVAALWSFGDNAYNGSAAGTDPSVSGQYVLTKSTDGGLTWSPPINITAAVKDDINWRLVFQGPGHGLAMRDGTLVFPSQYRDSTGTVRVCSVFSTDHGVTWDFGSGVPTASPQTNENTVCELDDGRLLFSMRTPSGSNGQRAWIHYTPAGTNPMRDGSWSSLFRLPSVPDPVCQGSVIHWTSKHRGHPREFVVFGNPASSSSRTNFTLRVSADGGASWPVSRLLYPSSSAYSSICVLPDKSIGVLFEKDNYTRITFARVEEEWLMNPDADGDADGLPDAWEMLYQINQASGDASRDDDGDGMSNLAEFQAGTDPRSAASSLRATLLEPGPDGWRFAWTSVPGLAYVVESSGDLAHWEPAMQVTASSSGTQVTVPRSAPGENAFFRARVVR